MVYTHFRLEQKGNVLTGQYLDESGKEYPLAGSVDGKTVRVVVSLPNGKALVFNGTQDAGSDMVGTLEGLRTWLDSPWHTVRNTTGTIT